MAYENQQKSTTEDMVTIRLDNLSIGYKDRIVAEGISANIKNGELTCLTGSNGTGKSTLLKTVCGFLPKQGGNIFLMDKDISEYGRKELARTIGVVLTDKPDVYNMKVAEIIGLGRSPYNGFWGSMDAEDRAAVDEAIDMTGIRSLASRMFHTLSDGERQKVMVAKAIAQQTQVMLLDEPTAFLDFPSKADIMRLLLRLSHELGKTVLLSTHDLGTAMQLSDRILFIDDEGKMHSGTPRDMMKDAEFASFMGRGNLPLSDDFPSIS